jgi:hypothetical protein
VLLLLLFVEGEGNLWPQLNAWTSNRVAPSMSSLYLGATSTHRGNIGKDCTNRSSCVKSCNVHALSGRGQHGDR